MRKRIDGLSLVADGLVSTLFTLTQSGLMERDNAG